MLTVDTPNASGHFDVAASGKIQPGCRIQIQGEGVVRIMGVTGDGTAPDSVTILGAIPAGVFDLVGIYGTEGVSALTLSGVVDGAAVISGGHYSSYMRLTPFLDHGLLDLRWNLQPCVSFLCAAVVKRSPSPEGRSGATADRKSVV